MDKKVEIKNTSDVVIPNEIKKGIDEGIQNVLSMIDDFNWDNLHDFKENISHYFSCGITYPEIYPTFSEGFGEFLYNEILEACGKEDDDYDYLEDYEDYINIRWEELYKKADVKVNDDYHSKYGIYYIDYGKDKKFDEKVDEIRFGFIKDAVDKGIRISFEDLDEKGYMYDINTIKINRTVLNDILYENILEQFDEHYNKEAIEEYEEYVFERFEEIIEELGYTWNEVSQIEQDIQYYVQKKLRTNDVCKSDIQNVLTEKINEKMYLDITFLPCEFGKTHEEVMNELEHMSVATFTFEDLGFTADEYFDDDYPYFTYENMIDASGWTNNDFSEWLTKTWNKLAKDEIEMLNEIDEDDEAEI